MKLLRGYFGLFFSILFSGFISAQNDLPPELNATSRQPYCPFSQINIAPNFTITDPDDDNTGVFFIQISSGYDANSDRLILTGNHPTIVASWNTTQGKLQLSPAGGNEILLTNLQAAVRDVVYESTDGTVSGEKFFSYNIDNANFLPSTGHFYEYVSDIGIDWESARQAAASRTYFGLQGYLATVTSADEAQITGEQSAGAGWIGGSDADEEGVWKWMTGPEAGTTFWIGGIVGASPNFAFWNAGEPNNLNNEDYAHVTDPTVGIPGSWNDLPINGDPSGPFQPKGYVVEYGGMPGDPTLNISASTSIYVPQIETTENGEVCQGGSTTLRATPSEGTVLWYDSMTGGNLLATGNTFTTPNITISTAYYATVSVNGCLDVPRTPVIATVNQPPVITEVIDDVVCFGGSAVISANAVNGGVVWYDSLTSTTPITTGGTLVTDALFTTTTYYVQAENGTCDSSIREPVVAVVDPDIPIFDVENEFFICPNSGGVTANIINPQGNYTYEWRDEVQNQVGNGTSAFLEQTGDYTVVGISAGGCTSDIKTIRVREIETTNFSSKDIQIDDVTSNNSIVVSTENLTNGTYEFAIDNPFGPFQTSTRFQNISPGLHTLYVKLIGGDCDAAGYEFVVLDYPSFFTPNNDGKNDVWQLTGIDPSFYTVSDIFIFNRFGVQVAKISSSSRGWNGTYQGKLLPSSDYWFSVKLTDVNGFTVERVGHFSLLRR